MFSVVFQHRIPKCINLILILCCGQTKVREYFSVLLRSKVVFVRFSESDSFTFKLSESESFTQEFPVTLLSLWSSQFPVFFLIRSIHAWALKAARNPTLTKERSDWQLHFFPSVSSFSLSPLPLLSYTSSYRFLLLFVLLFFLLFSLFLSLSIFSNCPVVPLYLVFCPHPFFCPLFECLLQLNLSCSLSSSIHLLLSDCPSWTIYQEWHPFTFRPSGFQHNF